MGLGVSMAIWADDDIVELEPLVTTAYPIIEASELTPLGRIDTISESNIESIGAGDLTSAIHRIPGVTISRYNPVGAYGGSDGGGIFIRGHGSGRPGADISTMIDGVPLFVGVWTHPLIDTLSIDMAASVEVMKSPQPVKHGNMGFGAVNIIPKKASVPGSSGALETQYGSHSTYLLKAQYGYQGDKSSILVSGSRRSSEGHRENADGEVDALYGHGSYQMSDRWSIEILGSATDSWANDPEPVGVSLPITERYATKNRFALVKLLYDSTDQYDFELKYHVEDGTGTWLQWHRPPPPPFPAQSLLTTTDYLNHGLKSEISGSIEGDWKWSAGMDWDRYGGAVEEDYSGGLQNQFEDLYFELLSPYAFVSRQVNLMGGEHEVTFSAGARYMDHSVFDPQWVGQVQVSHIHGPVQTYVEWSRSANYPGVFASVFGRRGPPWQVGEQWRSLNPESINHIEAGVSWDIGANIELEVSYFRDEVEDSIRFVTPPPAGFILNEGSYTIEGVESIVRARNAFGSVFLGSTWMDASDERPNLPSWSAVVGVHLERGPWSLNLDLQSFSEQSVDNPRFPGEVTSIDGYHLITGRISYLQETRVGLVSYYLLGENLSDTTYEFRPGYPMPGLSMTIGVKIEF
jgi:outer membrane cobalamin receptor